MLLAGTGAGAGAAVTPFDVPFDAPGAVGAEPEPDAGASCDGGCAAPRPILGARAQAWIAGLPAWVAIAAGETLPLGVPAAVAGADADADPDAAELPPAGELAVGAEATVAGAAAAVPVDGDGGALAGGAAADDVGAFPLEGGVIASP